MMKQGWKRTFLYNWYNISVYIAGLLAVVLAIGNLKSIIPSYNPFHGVMILHLDPAHNIRRSVFNLLPHALDASLLFTGQIATCLQRVGAATADFDERPVPEEMLFRNGAPTGGKVLFGSVVVSGEAVTVGYAILVAASVPGGESDTISVCM